jgi:tetratricopeptide (TPR) repeat protein
MAIRGSLKEASLPDVLQLLAMGKKTGCLSVTHRSSFGYIYFDAGRISHASIVNRRDRLGGMLLQSGLMTKEELDAAIAEQSAHPGMRLGEVLVARGVIARDVLHDQIRAQIEEAVYYLFTWTQGTFNFESDVRPEEGELVVAINPESLLLEGARRIDEWALVEKKVPSLDVVFELDRRRLAESGATLTAEQAAVARLLDGRRDVAAIAEDAGLAEFEVGKALYGLATAGLAHRIGRTKPAEPRVSDTRVDEHRNLGIAFYKTGMNDEALREFRRVAELRPGDTGAVFYVGLVHLRAARWAEAASTFASIAEQPGVGFAAHHNLAYALERLGRWDEARAALDAAVRRGGDGDARVLTTLGAVLLRTGDAAAAADALARARPLAGRRGPSAAWFHYATLAAAVQGDLDGAASTLTEALGVHPHSAVLHNDAALLHEWRGEYSEAAAAAERGAHEDTTVPQLHKNVGDYHYRAGRYDEALEAYTRASKAAEAPGADLYFKLGNIRYRRRETAEAVRCWERALELNPAHAIVRTNLAAVRPTL